MDEYYTIKQAAALAGYSTNTIRNWIRAGMLTADLVEGKYGNEYQIKSDNLYHSGIPKLNRRLGPQMVEARQAEQADKYLERLDRLTQELIDARSELGALRFQVPALQAAQAERDQLREERDRLVREREALAAKAEVLEVALDQARADMRWRARRRLEKRAPGGSK